MVFQDLLLSEPHDFVIIGCGATLRDYREKVVTFSRDKVTLGINNMQDVLTPKYNLWTNNGRLEKFGHLIAPESTIIFGSHLKEKNVAKYDYQYIVLDYTDKPGPFGMSSDGVVTGFFRTAGCLAIYFARLMGAKNIYLAGFDGYGLHWGGNQHVYGQGMTDNNTDEYCAEKDGIIYDVMHSLSKIVPFKIITPTIYTDFYDGGVIG